MWWKQREQHSLCGSIRPLRPPPCMDNQQHLFQNHPDTPDTCEWMLRCAGRSLKAELSEVYWRFLGYFYCGKALKRFLLSYFWGKNVFSKLNLLLSCRCTNSQSSLLLVECCDLITKCSSESNLCSTLTGKWETSWSPRRSAVVPLLLDRVSFPIMLSVQD